MGALVDGWMDDGGMGGWMHGWKEGKKRGIIFLTNDYTANSPS